MRKFETGAVRDDSDGRGRYDLPPWGAIRALAQLRERGAIHYVAALWNIAWAVEQEIKRPEMVDLPERNEKSGKAW